MLKNKMYTIYLDMDGVLADFNKAYSKLKINSPDNAKLFRASVMDHKIFETLDMMPDTHELLNHIKHILNTSNDVHVEILTSTGTFDPFQAEEAKRQKKFWLAKHKIPYKPNFVNAKREKAQYANQNSILIDDSVGCISPFIEARGHGILHKTASDTIRILDSTLLQLRAINA